MTDAEVAPFLLAGDARPGAGGRGVLLIHGFAGSPWIWRFAGERLAARGFTVLAPCLAGHDGTVAGVNRTGWRDWVAGSATALAELRSRCSRVAVAGLSLGGLLALHLAHEDTDLTGVVSLATPLWLARWAMWTARGLDRLGVAGFPKSRVDVRDPVMIGKVPSMDAFPIHAMTSMLDFMPLVRAELPAITVPAFVAHGALDTTVPPACSREIVARLGGPEVRCLPLPRSAHLITVDVEREKLVAAMAAFLDERMPA